jgi:hypothetical protein
MKDYFGTGSMVALAGAALAAAALSPVMAGEEKFSQTNIHFETNASACDMGVQMSFDSDGLTRGSVEDPNEKVVFSFQAVDGMAATQDITEVFQERVEPPIIDLQNALGCEPTDDAISLAELLATWPAGRYEFEGESDGVEFEGAARLTHKVPAGPEITAPADGTIVPHDAPLLVTWKKVTKPLLPSLGPVEVVGYHVVVVDITSPDLLPGQTKTSFNADISRNETSFVVPKQYLEPGRIYELEVLATEKGGNQTITEAGAFCTPPIAPSDCKIP